MSFFDNTCKPTGLDGKLMAAMMKLGHRSLADWGLRYLALAPGCRCSGLRLRRRLKHQKAAEKVPRGVVKGIDYSAVSVEKARKGYDHMQYQIRDPQGFAQMLVSLMEQNRIHPALYIRTDAVCVYNF